MSEGNGSSDACETSQQQQQLSPTPPSSTFSLSQLRASSPVPLQRFVLAPHNNTVKQQATTALRARCLPAALPDFDARPDDRGREVDDELAKECLGPGGAGIIGALSRIVRRHGRAGLWRGMVPVLITMGVSNFVYFYCFSGLKAALLSRQRALAAQAARTTSAAAATAAAENAATAAGALLKNGAPIQSLNGGGGRGGAAGKGEGILGLTPLQSMLASTIAGVVNVLATTPLWVSNMRIKAGNGVGGLFSTLSWIGRNEGLAGLWSGTAPSLVLVCNPIIQFVVYEALKQVAGNRRLRRGGGGGVADLRTTGSGADANAAAGASSGRAPGLPSHEAFLLGATAKTISTLITYPLQLAQTKLRVGGAQSPNSEETRVPAEGWRGSVAWQVLTCWSSTADVLVSVCRDNGVAGMYQGMRAKLLHTVLTSALLFLGYERLVQAIANVMADRAAAATAAATATAPIASPGKANTANFASPLVRGASSSISKRVA